MEDKKIINGNCWVAYCDILGFKKMIQTFEKGAGVGHLNVFVNNYYSEIIEALERQRKYNPDNIIITWFSDSFLFFTRDDSKDSFGDIHNCFNLFCWEVISKQWPLRAAIGFGQLYADVSKNLFLGSGIINAYEYAENQNWIGAIVTPEANDKLDEYDIDLSRWRATKYPVPFHKQAEEKKAFESEYFVLKIHHDRPDVKEAIERMNQEAMGEKDYQSKYRIKYENTLKFINENP